MEFYKIGIIFFAGIFILAIGYFLGNFEQSELARIRLNAFMDCQKINNHMINDIQKAFDENRCNYFYKGVCYENNLGPLVQKSLERN